MAVLSSETKASGFKPFTAQAKERSRQLALTDLAPSGALAGRQPLP